jgi:hypothetical protein
MGAERLGDMCRDQATQLSALRGDFLDQTGAEVGVARLGHQIDRVDFGREVAIHRVELRLELIVGRGPEAADKCHCTARSSELDRKAAVGYHVDVGYIGEGVAKECDPLINPKGERLSRAIVHRHDEPFEQPGRAVGDVDMSEMDGVERAGVDSEAVIASVRLAQSDSLAVDASACRVYKLTAARPWRRVRSSASGPRRGGGSYAAACSQTRSACAVKWA